MRINSRLGRGCYTISQKLFTVTLVSLVLVVTFRDRLGYQCAKKHAGYYNKVNSVGLLISVLLALFFVLFSVYQWRRVEIGKREAGAKNSTYF